MDHCYLNNSFRQLLLCRHLENLDNRLNQDISSIFALLRDNAYQYSSLPSSNAHLLGNQDATQPSQHALAHSELADESVFLLTQSSDQKEENVSPENRLSIKEINISKPPPKPLPSKPRSSSAVNISCQTPQSIQSKRALSTSGGTRDLIPGSQVSLLHHLQRLCNSMQYDLILLQFI